MGLPQPGYFLQSGCQLFSMQLDILVCAAGTFRSSPNDPATLVFVTFTGTSNGRIPVISLNSNTFGQLLGPPALNRATKMLYLVSYMGPTASKAFSVFQIRLNEMAEITSDPVLLYSLVDPSRYSPSLFSHLKF